MSTQTLRHAAAALILFAAALVAAGCGPLVGVRVTVRLDEQTRLEQEVLGRRAEAAPQDALLSVARAPGPSAELRQLADECAALEQRLAGSPRHDAALRAWQVIAVHNRAVLQAETGSAQDAVSLLKDALRRAQAFGFATLEWQILLTQAELKGAKEGAEDLKRAADVLASAPVLTQLDYGFESRERRSRLFAALVAAALDANDSESALRYAAEHEAIELARALPPGRLSAPAGSLHDAVQELEVARAAAAQAREALCRLSLEDAAGDPPPPARAAFEQAAERLKGVGERLRTASPAGGLLVPDVADATAVQEILPQDTVLLLYEPLGGDLYAGFVLGAGAFRAARLQVPLPVAAGVSARQALDGGLVPAAPAPGAAEAAGRALLEPFAPELGGSVRRVYLVPPAELSGAAWESLPFQGKALGERFELAYLGGLSDLVWAFKQKGFGRESLLVCGGRPEAMEQAAKLIKPQAQVTLLDVQQRGKADLPGALAFADVVWFTDALEVRAGDAAASYLAFPGALGLLSGVSAADFASYRTRATCAAFGAVAPGAYDERAFASLRVMTRSLIAAGVPSVVYASGGGRLPDGGGDYWRAFLKAVGDRAASAAQQQASGVVPAQYRPAFRLYGYAGMNADEYREFSTQEFNDLARSAGAHLSAGRFLDAATDLLDLRRMAQAMQFDTEPHRLHVLEQVQQQLVRCFHELGEYELAVRHQKLLIDYLKADEGGRGPLSAVAYQSLGALLTEAERFQEAAEAYARSIELLKVQGDQQDLAAVLGELGKSQDRAAEYEQALQTFREALQKYRELQQPAGVAKQHQRIGAIYLLRLNNAPRAEEEFAEARRLYEAAGAAADAAETTIDLGLCRRVLGDFQGALGLFQQALQDAEKGGLRATQARALTELANTRWFRGEYQQALELVGRSNEIAGQLRAAYRLNMNYQLLGLIYWELNDYERALHSLDTAIEHAKRAQTPLETASAYNNRGIVYRRQGEYEKALASFGQALEIDTRLRTRWGEGYDHRNIGMTLHLMGRYDEASEHLERAVELTRAIQDRVNLAKALLALGELRLDQGKLDDSRKLLDDALQQAREVYLPEVEWRALRSLGSLNRKQGDNEAALKAFEQGVEVVERMRGGIKIEEFQSGFLADKMDLYEDTVKLLLDMDRTDEAFKYSEQSRIRKFMDILAGQKFELKTDRERQLYARQEELGREIRAVQEALAREKDQAHRAVLATQLDQAQHAYADVLVDIRVANPALSSFVTVEVAAPKDLAAVLPNDVPLVVYCMLPDEVAIWVLRNGKLEVRRVQANRDEVTKMIRDYRIMVQNRDLLDDVKRASEELNRVLVAPIADLIAGSSAVGIVPHRGLHYLSFASLYDGKAFLVERHPLFYSPSASALRRTLEAQAPAGKGELQVLAVGNPAVGDPAYELPFTEMEVESLAQDFVNVTALTGARATEDWVKENISRFDVVHIGAHGRFDPVNPLFSSLMLAPGKDDGQLELNEVMGLRLKARLVTLSACQSGLGELRSGDELVSLSRAFEYAGTRSILSTLWRVDDVATALVSKHFYRWYVGHGAAESLQHGQLQVMNDGRHYHPTYWAGVVLTGDYR